MSELDNQKSKLELGMSYTPLPICLRNLVTHYNGFRGPVPEGYRQRDEEIKLANGP
jgi:hypothetical protein